MRKQLLLLLLVACCTSAGLAQRPSDPFAAAIEAHGGAAIQSIHTLRVRAQSTIGNTKPQPLTISARLDGSLRLDYGLPVTRTDISTQEGTVLMIDGKTSWLAPHARAFTQLDLLSVFGIQHLAVGTKKIALENASVAGRAVGRVRVATGREKTAYRRVVKDEAEVSFDAQTGLVSAITREQFADESLDLPFTMTTTFSDYRPEAGFLLPFRIDRYVNGILRETIAVESIELNPAFAAETFGR